MQVYAKRQQLFVIVRLTCLTASCVSRGLFRGFEIPEGVGVGGGGCGGVRRAGGERLYPRLHCHNKTKQGPGEIKGREVVLECVLDPQVSPEKIMSREVELGCES